MAPDFGVTSVNSDDSRSRDGEQHLQLATSASSYFHVLSSSVTSAGVEDNGRQVIWHGLTNQLDPGGVLDIVPSPSYTEGAPAILTLAAPPSIRGDFATPAFSKERHQLKRFVSPPKINSLNSEAAKAALLGVQNQQITGQDLQIPVSFPVPSAPSSFRLETLHVTSRQLGVPNQILRKESAFATPSGIELGARAVNSNETPLLTGLTISPGGGGDTEKRVGFKEMPQNAQHRARNSGDTKRPQVSRMASVDSTRSNFPQSPYVEEYIKPDTPDAELRSTPVRQEIAGIGRPSSIVRSRHIVEAPRDNNAGLPSEKGFPIQIGSELFRLSGASIMSDSPSYFSKFFEEQLRQNEDGTGGVRTLFIDRDPDTFRDICRHLQGYHVKPRDGGHYVRLFADAQFYSLPRLISQLFHADIFIQIGGHNFEIPRDIFASPGNTPNYFTLGFAAFFAEPQEIFPGLDREGLLRPPSIMAPSVPNRSAQIFEDILHLLRGYPLHVRSDEHRVELLRDCRYFHLRGLEQKLIQHHLSYNIERQRSEIVLRLEDIKQSGISFMGDVSASDRSPLGGWVNYCRPFADESSSELILEIGGEATKIEFRTMRADFHGDAKARITSLFQVVANKMNLPTTVPLGLMMSSGGIGAQPVSPGNTPLSDDKVKVRIERDAYVTLDGEEYHMDANGFESYSDFSPHDGTFDGSITQPMSATLNSPASWPIIDPNASQHTSRPSSTKPPPRKRKRRGSLDDFGEWIVRKGQWRLRVQPRTDYAGSEPAMEVVLHAVKLDAVSGQRGRNLLRGFLG